MFCSSIKRRLVALARSRPRSVVFNGWRFMATATNSDANVVYGRPIADRLLSACQNDCRDFLKQHQRRPNLVAILVGGNESSKLYVRNKQRVADDVGIDFRVVNHLMHVTPASLIDTIQQLNSDETVDGIILQLPLPLHLISQTHEFIDLIRADKDVDGHTTSNNHSYRQASMPLVTIPVVGAVRAILLEIGQPLQGKDVVVIGSSKYVGTPIALMLSQTSTEAHSDLVSGATVTICHHETPANNLAQHCKNADVIVSAVGRAKLVTRQMVKQGATVIDVGISKGSTGKKSFVGDVDFDEVKGVARWITPVPGGVGPLTVACLMLNLLKLARQRRR